MAIAAAAAAAVSALTETEGEAVPRTAGVGVPRGRWRGALAVVGDELSFPPIPTWCGRCTGEAPVREVEAAEVREDCREGAPPPPVVAAAAAEEPVEVKLIVGGRDVLDADCFVFDDLVGDALTGLSLFM